VDSNEEKSLHQAALQNAASMVAARRRAEAERDQARADAEAARAELEALNQVGITLASELDLERVVQTVTDAATKLTCAQFGAFFYNVVDHQGEKRHSRISGIRARRLSSRRRFTALRSCGATTSRKIRVTARWDHTMANHLVTFRCAAISRCRSRRVRAT